jgi:lysophospholipase L1-like esterase
MPLYPRTSLNPPNVFKNTYLNAVLIGDSITNQCYTEFAADSFCFPQAGYFATASLALKGKLRCIAEMGIGGNRTDQINARLPTAIALNPDIIVYLGGTNDMNNLAYSAERIIENIVAAANYVVEKGIIFCVCTVPPKNTAVDGTANAFATKQAQVNWAIANIVGSIPGVVVADFYSCTVNPATGGYASGMSTDGVHPLPAGSYKMGIALAQALEPFLNSNSRANTMPNYGNNAWNMVYNPFMNGNNAAGTNGFTVGTGITGTGPDGYAVSRYINSPTGVCSTVEESAVTNLGLNRRWTQVVAAAWSGDSDSIVVRNNVNHSNAWVGSVSMLLGSYRVPTAEKYNGYAYRCIAAGTSGTVEPVWPTVLGLTIVDNGATWQCVPLVTPGKRYVACMEYNISSASGLISPVLTVQCVTPAGSVIEEMIGNRRSTSDVMPSGYVPNGVIWTPEFYCPAEVTRLQLNAGVYGMNGGAATFQITGMQLINIPDDAPVPAYL